MPYLTYVPTRVPYVPYVPHVPYVTYVTYVTSVLYRLHTLHGARAHFGLGGVTCHPLTRPTRSTPRPPPTTGLPLAIAIAIHNIPEGLAIAMPVFYATHSRTRAITLGALSGFSEPFGAILASLVANENSSEGAFGGMFGLTAGISVISV